MVVRIIAVLHHLLLQEPLYEGCSSLHHTPCTACVCLVQEKEVVVQRQVNQHLGCHGMLDLLVGLQELGMVRA